MTDAESKWSHNLTLSMAHTPDGFACLAAAVLSQLKRHGRVFLYLDANDNILHKDPRTEVAIAEEPVLIVPPNAVIQESYNQDTGVALVDLTQTQLLQRSGLILEQEDTDVDERPLDSAEG